MSVSGGGERGDGDGEWRGGVERRSGEEEWRGGVERRCGEEQWRGGVERRSGEEEWRGGIEISYTHLRANETAEHIDSRLLIKKKIDERREYVNKTRDRGQRQTM